MSEPHVVLYAKPDIDWHRRYAPAFVAGLSHCGVRVTCASKPQRHLGSAIPLILGPNCFGAVQQDCYESKRPYVLVNRAFWGDPDAVAIGWNGMNGHADFVANTDLMLPTTLGLKPLREPKRDGLCLIMGQYDLATYEYPSLDAWYERAKADVRAAFPRMRVVVRPHPAVSNNPMPLQHCLENVDLVMTLNSTACVATAIAGIRTVAQDRGSCGWGVLPSHPAHPMDPATRLPWLRRLASSQWRHDQLHYGKWWLQLTSRAPLNQPQPPKP
jgi:hypothetical protein